MSGKRNTRSKTTSSGGATQQQQAAAAATAASPPRARRQRSDDDDERTTLRPRAIQPPAWDGDPDTWLAFIRNFELFSVTVDFSSEIERGRHCFGLGVDKGAIVFHQVMKAIGPNVTFDEIVKYINDHVLHTDRNLYLRHGKIQDIRYTKNLDTYIEDFKSAVLAVEPLSAETEAVYVSQFIRGLPTSLNKSILQRDNYPKNLAATYALARRLEMDDSRASALTASTAMPAAATSAVTVEEITSIVQAVLAQQQQRGGPDHTFRRGGSGGYRGGHRGGRGRRGGYGGSGGSSQRRNDDQQDQSQKYDQTCGRCHRKGHISDECRAPFPAPKKAGNGSH